MGLELLRKEMLDAAQAQAQKADEDATAKMHEIVRAAHMQAKALVEKAREEGRAFVDAERSERLSAARLEAGRALSEAREAAVNAALEKVWAEFCKRRSTHGYRQALLRLAEKAAGELSRSHAVLLANERDAKLLGGATRKFRVKQMDCAGGVAAETADGKIRVDYSFEEIFAQAREGIRKEIYARMFPAGGRGEAGAGKKRGGARGRRGNARMPLHRAQKRKARKKRLPEKGGKSR